MGGFSSESRRQDMQQQITNINSITMAGFMSFIARGLASISGHLFCYSAISSAAIVGILPGYLIRKSPPPPTTSSHQKSSDTLLTKSGVLSNLGPRMPFVER